MANIIELKMKGPNTENYKIEREFCDECGQALSFWWSPAEDAAYGICDYCHLGAPTSVEWGDMCDDGEE